MPKNKIDMTAEERFLLKSFQKGFIPGPKEKEAEFFQRVKRLKAIESQGWEEASIQTKAVFGLTTSWVPFFYSNQKISWWEGGVTWIGDKGDPSIQLRTQFQTGSFLGYHRVDILAHEAVHASRVCFQESHFEEILAYSISNSKWKRFFGPIFTHSWEPFCFILGCLLGMIYWYVWVGMSVFWLGWLFLRQWTFRKCVKKMSFSVVLCLRDREIWRFAWRSTSHLFQSKSLREKLILLLRKRDDS